MNIGQCLCGSVKWQVTGDPDESYHCHCTMCRKAHAAAFGTYWFVSVENVSWIGDSSTIQDYQSSDSLVRPFCNCCGSLVPGKSEDAKHYYVPAGCHDDGKRPDAHIFIDYKAPWLTIDDDLEKFGAAPPGGMPDIEAPALSPTAPGVTRGSCLCGEVAFEVVAPFKVVHNCHCTRCRRARAAAFTTNGFTTIEGVRFVRGEERVKTFKLPSAKYFSHAFCDRCGSGMPRLDPGRNIAVVPMGVLDDDPGVFPVDHIFVENKVGWYDPPKDIPHFEGYPSS